MKARILQRGVIKRLKASGTTPFITASLSRCTKTQCTRSPCRQICIFGARRWQAESIAAPARHVKKPDGPLFAVGVGRAQWCKPLGELHRISLSAASKLVRRAFDSLYNPSIVAVGTFKITSGSDQFGPWRMELDLVVAGVSSKDLYQIFATRRYRAEDFLVISAVDDVTQAVTNALTHHQNQTPGSSRDSKSLRHTNADTEAELDAWLLSMPTGALAFRYGCDRYFAKLKKSHRPRLPKPRKRRRSPDWLQQYQFGSDTRVEMDVAKNNSGDS